MTATAAVVEREEVQHEPVHAVAVASPPPRLINTGLVSTICVLQLAWLGLLAYALFGVL
jgi:hypothetical protein